MITQYLNKDGYPMEPEEKPIFLRYETKAQSYARVARYVVCPQTNMLKWIGHCEDCKEFRGHVKYNGVNCAIKTK